MELTVSKSFKLEPYGKFSIKWRTRQGHIPNIIPMDELSYDSRTGMTMTPDQLKEVVKLMKKNKTDILTDGTDYYTRLNDDLIKVSHKKLNMYASDPAFKNAVDLGQSFGRIMLNNA